MATVHQNRRHALEFLSSMEVARDLRGCELLQVSWGTWSIGALNKIMSKLRREKGEEREEEEEKEVEAAGMGLLFIKASG